MPSCGCGKTCQALAGRMNSYRTCSYCALSSALFRGLKSPWRSNEGRHIQKPATEVGRGRQPAKMVRIEFLCSCPLQAKKRHRRCIRKNCSYLLTGRWLNLTRESFLRSFFDLKQLYRFDARNSYTVMQMKVCSWLRLITASDILAHALPAC